MSGTLPLSRNGWSTGSSPTASSSPTAGTTSWAPARPARTGTAPQPRTGTGNPLRTRRAPRPRRLPQRRRHPRARRLPALPRPHPLDTDGWARVGAAVQAWSETGAADLPCPHCATATPIPDWTWADAPSAFGHLGLRFWSGPTSARSSRPASPASWTATARRTSGEGSERVARQGLSRSTDQPPSVLTTYRSRSCSRFSRPCQNSTDSGITRKPPQCGGTGTCSPSGYRAVSSA